MPNRGVSRFTDEQLSHFGAFAYGVMEGYISDGRGRSAFIANALETGMHLLNMHPGTTEKTEPKSAIDSAREVVESYAGWYRESPEDSWRFERDIRVALGMPEADEE